VKDERVKDERGKKLIILNLSMRQFENSCIEYEPRLYSERERKEESISLLNERAPRSEWVKDYYNLKIVFNILRFRDEKWHKKRRQLPSFFMPFLVVTQSSNAFV